MSRCHFSDEMCEGIQKYDETFNPNSPEAQLALMVTKGIMCYSRLSNFCFGTQKPSDTFKYNIKFASLDSSLTFFSHL